MTIKFKELPQLMWDPRDDKKKDETARLIWDLSQVSVELASDPEICYIYWKYINEHCVFNSKYVTSAKDLEADFAEKTGKKVNKTTTFPALTCSIYQNRNVKQHRLAAQQYYIGIGLQEHTESQRTKIKIRGPRNKSLTPLILPPTINTIPKSKTPINTIPKLKTHTNTIPESKTPINTIPKLKTHINTIPESKTPINTIPELKTPTNTILESKTSINTILESKTRSELKSDESMSSSKIKELILELENIKTELKISEEARLEIKNQLEKSQLEYMETKNQLEQTKSYLIHFGSELIKAKELLDRSAAELIKSEKISEQHVSKLVESKTLLEQSAADIIKYDTLSTQYYFALSQTKSELTQTESELSETKSELSEIKTLSEQYLSELTQTKSELTQTKSLSDQYLFELTQTKSDLTQNKSELTQTKTLSNQYLSELTQTKTLSNQYLSELTQTKTLSNQYLSELTQTKSELMKNISETRESKDVERNGLNEKELVLSELNLKLDEIKSMVIRKGEDSKLYIYNPNLTKEENDLAMVREQIIENKLILNKIRGDVRSYTSDLNEIRNKYDQIKSKNGQLEARLRSTMSKYPKIVAEIQLEELTPPINYAQIPSTNIVAPYVQNYIEPNIKRTTR